MAPLSMVNVLKLDAIHALATVMELQHLVLVWHANQNVKKLI